jgi:hypothetical protein
VVVKHLDRTHPNRDVVRQGPRPARDRHRLPESDHPRAGSA